jgi:dTDP-glucose 4,6-dehydratase
MARFVVTGGAGFIGSHLVDRLLSLGHSVVAIDNLITGSLKNLEHLRSDRSFEFLEADVAERFPDVGRADGVYHLASPASPVDFVPKALAILRVGSLGTLNAIEFARGKGAWFFLASTSEIYGDPLVHPQREDYFGNVNPNGIRSCYDESKRFAEALTMAYRRTHGLKTSIVRIFNTYGPRMRPDDGRAIPNFCTQAIRGEPLTVYGDGSQTRSLCYVDDLVDGFIRCFDRKPLEPVNLGNPREMTMLELAEAVLRVSGSNSRIEFRELPEGDPKQRCPDIARARKILEWEPKTPLDRGLAATIEYFRKPR